MQPNPSGWMVAAILLLVGASMVMNPDSITMLGRNLRTGIRNFEQRDRWWRQFRRYSFPDDRTAPFGRTSVRLAGLAVIAAGLLAAVIS